MKAADGKIAVSRHFFAEAMDDGIRDSEQGWVLYTAHVAALSAAEEQLAEAKRSLAHKDAHYNASLDNLLRMNARSEERVRVLREAMSRYKGVRDGFGDVTADAALATPAPEQPSEQEKENAK